MTPEELKRDYEICREKVGDRFLNRAEQRLTALEVTLWGQGGRQWTPGRHPRTAREVGRASALLLDRNSHPAPHGGLARHP